MWLYDRSPAKPTNVLGSDCIGMTSAATRYTTEGCLIRTVCLVGMPTGWAPPRGIARVDQGNGNACKPGLIHDIALQLKERPAMQHGALRLPSPYPRANVLEIFKRDSSLRALSLPNDAFADRVVDIFGKARLLPRQFPEAPLC